MRLQQECKPDAIQELDRQIMTIQIELESLRKETDIASKERREQAREDLDAQARRSGDLTEKWEKEKAEIDESKIPRKSWKLPRLELDQAQREGNFGKAAELRYARIPELQKKLPEEEGGEKSQPHASDGRLIHDSVTADDIATVVSRSTGIPVNKLMAGEVEKLVHMEDTLRRSRFADKTRL